jgi:hypothetical protein
MMPVSRSLMSVDPLGRLTIDHGALRPVSIVMGSPDGCTPAADVALAVGGGADCVWSVFGPDAGALAVHPTSEPIASSEPTASRAPIESRADVALTASL